MIRWDEDLAFSFRLAMSKYVVARLRRFGVLPCQVVSGIMMNGDIRFACVDSCCQPQLNRSCYANSLRSCAPNQVEVFLPQPCRIGAVYMKLICLEL